MDISIERILAKREISDDLQYDHPDDIPFIVESWKRQITDIMADDKLSVKYQYDHHIGYKLTLQCQVAPVWLKTNRSQQGWHFRLDDKGWLDKKGREIWAGPYQDLNGVVIDAVRSVTERIADELQRIDNGQQT